jgi:hypothetical protein
MFQMKRNRFRSSRANEPVSRPEKKPRSAGRDGRGPAKPGLGTGPKAGPWSRRAYWPWLRMLKYFSGTVTFVAPMKPFPKM